MNNEDFPANPIEKAGYMLEFQEEFDSSSLNLDKWIPYYLPQWSSLELAASRYTFGETALNLEIQAEQAPWCPEFDGELKCSSLQTGLFSGEVGSSIGQHRFKPNVVVREKQEKKRTYTPQYGYFETHMKVEISARNMVALWMIGFEEVPQESGEICIFEVYGKQMNDSGSELRYGVHPFADNLIRDEFYREVLTMDTSKYHVYAAEWTPSHIDYYVDNIKRRTIQQSPNYPMQFMLGIYEFPSEEKDTKPYPKQFTIDYFRAYQPIAGYQY